MNKHIEPPREGTKYYPLYRHLICLKKKGEDKWEASFDDIEKVLGSKLPNAARNHRPWWANQKDCHNRPQARAWMSAGWETRDVDMENEIVVFVCCCCDGTCCCRTSED